MIYALRGRLMSVLNRGPIDEINIDRLLAEVATERKKPEPVAPTPIRQQYTRTGKRWTYDEIEQLKKGEYPKGRTAKACEWRMRKLNISQATTTLSPEIQRQIGRGIIPDGMNAHRAGTLYISLVTEKNDPAFALTGLEKDQILYGILPPAMTMEQAQRLRARFKRNYNLQHWPPSPIDWTRSEIKAVQSGKKPAGRNRAECSAVRRGLAKGNFSPRLAPVTREAK